MIYFVTGAKGQLGSDVVKQLNKVGNVVYASDIDTVDITVRSEVLNTISECNPDVIIHCAAWTAVDRAEDEKEEAYNINVNGTKHVVEAAMITNAKLIYISTDYVYDGIGNKEHKESDFTSPVNYYGQTKLEGEEEVLKYAKSFIVRVSWVFGLNGNNFVKTMIKLGSQKREIDVVEDQVGSPTYTRDLAVLLEELSLTTDYGIYNASNEGVCSWAEFARFVFDLKGMRTVVNGIESTDFKTRAKRPLNSKMSKAKLDEYGFSRLPDWHNAVRSFINELERMGD